MKLTQTIVNKLAIANGKPEQVFLDDDVPGLALRIRAAGSRKYVVNYRQGDRRSRYTIGKANVWTLDDARKEARRILSAVDKGEDPAAEKATKQAASALVFSTVVDDYLDAVKAGLRPRSLVECTRHLRKAWRPLDGLALGTVSRITVATRLRELAKTSGHTAANRARSTLSAMYAWAIGEGLCESNPVIGTNKAEEAGTRERVLTDAELVAIWDATPEGDYGRIVRLLMLTGQRRDEIACLRWSEIDAVARTITLPRYRTKNGREHVVPLSAEAMAIIDETPLQARDAVFGEGPTGYSGFSAPKVRLDERLGNNVKPWTLHDLRRTAATRMADSGVQPHIIEAVLNHVGGHKGGIAGVYNRAMYEPEKRAALDTLATYISTARAKAEGANVTRSRA